MKEDFVDKEEVVQSYVNESSIVSSAKNFLFGNDESDYNTDEDDTVIIDDMANIDNSSASTPIIQPIRTKHPKIVSMLIFAHGTLLNTRN